MPKFEMVAVQAHRYADVMRKPGDKYQVNGETDRRLMKALSWSDDAPPRESEVPKAQAIQAVRAAKPAAKTITRSMAPADETPKAPAAKRAGGYFTRRLHADDAKPVDGAVGGLTTETKPTDD